MENYGQRPPEKKQIRWLWSIGFFGVCLICIILNIMNEHKTNAQKRDGTKRQYTSQLARDLQRNQKGVKKMKRQYTPQIIKDLKNHIGIRTLYEWRDQSKFASHPKYRYGWHTVEETLSPFVMHFSQNHIAASAHGDSYNNVLGISLSLYMFNPNYEAPSYLTFEEKCKKLLKIVHNIEMPDEILTTLKNYKSKQDAPELEFKKKFNVQGVKTPIYVRKYTHTPRTDGKHGYTLSIKCISDFSEND